MKKRSRVPVLMRFKATGFPLTWPKLLTGRSGNVYQNDKPMPERAWPTGEIVRTVAGMKPMIKRPRRKWSMSIRQAAIALIDLHHLSFPVYPAGWPIGLGCLFIFPRSKKKKQDLWPIQRSDLDNYIYMVWNSLKATKRAGRGTAAQGYFPDGILYNDDNQIVASLASGAVFVDEDNEALRYPGVIITALDLSSRFQFGRGFQRGLIRESVPGISDLPGGVAGAVDIGGTDAEFDPNSPNR